MLVLILKQDEPLLLDMTPWGLGQVELRVEHRGSRVRVAIDADRRIEIVRPERREVEDVACAR